MKINSSGFDQVIVGLRAVEIAKMWFPGSGSLGFPLRTTYFPKVFVTKLKWAGEFVQV